MHQRLATKLINAVSAAAWLPRQVRVGLWRAAGVKVSTIVDVRSGCWMNTPRLALGEKVFINAGLTVDGFEQVSIGDECWLGVNVTLLTSSHRIGGTARRAGEITSAPITIGAGCWLGAGVTVLPGVTIGPGCVVGAASMVTRDLEANGLYVGSPAKLVRLLPGSGSDGVEADPRERTASA